MSTNGYKKYEFKLSEFTGKGEVKRLPHIFMDGVETVLFNGVYVGFINTSVNPELVITYSNSTKLLLREAE